MRVLVTFAVDAEFAPWRKLRKFRRLSANENRAAHFVSRTEGAQPLEIAVLLTGIGEATALKAVETSRFLGDMKPHLLISSGFAGGLKPEFTAGAIIAPEKTRTLKNHINIDSDVLAREVALRFGAAPIQNLITVDRLVKTAEEKSRLAFFGEAVDMESAIVMSRFAREGIPVLALRAISDVSGEDLPLDFDRCLTPHGAIKPLNLVNQIVRRPGNLPEIMRFGKQSLEARQKMAQFLEKFLGSVPVLFDERLAHA